MNERFTLYFKRGATNTYKLESTRLEAFGTNGVAEKCKILKARSDARPGDWAIPDTKTPLIIALAFVRAAQWKFVRIADATGVQVPIFRESSGSRIVHQFRNLRADATKDPGNEDSHASRWLQEMLSFPDDSEEFQRGGRLVKWFPVSHRPVAVVNCNLMALPPASIVVLIDSEPADELALDHLESYLSRTLFAGYPFHLGVDGLVIAGCPPSIQPHWFDQEEEWRILKEIYSSAQTPIFCVLGDSATGKTVFAMNSLRRLAGQKKLRQRLVFSWSFNRQGVSTYILVPLTMFFVDLANALGINLGETMSPVEQAKAILVALRAKPAFLMLDGMEAVFRLPQPGDPATTHLELSKGVAELLRGLAGLNDSFVLATSRVDFAIPFGLPPTSVHHLALKDTPFVDELRSLREFEREISKQDESLKKTDENPLTDPLAKPSRSTSRADFLRTLKKISGCDSEQAFHQWFDSQLAALSPPESLSLALASQPMSKIEMQMLNIILKHMHGSLAEILLHILCVCHHPITEKDLLSVAASPVMRDQLGLAKAPSDEEWVAALGLLVGTEFLEQPCLQNVYSVHAAKRRVIADGLKKNKPLRWIAINKALGERLLANSPEFPSKRVELPPLVDAAIYLCQAGEKLRAYQEIGFRRLCRGLQGYCIVQLGEYEASIALQHALMGDLDDAAVSDLPPESEALNMLANAICLRYLDSLDVALSVHTKAWLRAKLTKKPEVILPVGSNLLRLHHIFGLLNDAREVERTIFLLVLKNGILRVGDFSDHENMQEGIAFMTSLLALSLLYRGKAPLLLKLFGTAERVASRILDAGIKQCRHYGAEFKNLMPRYGRPWHALTLLELGKWDICESAFKIGEWGSELVRYQQTGFFEVLAAKMFLSKAQTLTGARQSEALTSAAGWADKAFQKANEGNYRWWKTFSTLVQGQVFTLDEQGQRANQLIATALELSQKNGFQLLTVDALLAKAELARSAGRLKDSQIDAASSLSLAETIGYGLRNNALQKLVNAAR